VTPEQLSQAIRSALVALNTDGAISADLDALEIVVERPKSRDHGDWATNVAMQLGGKIGMAPRSLAELVAKELSAFEGIESLEIAGPGFINISLSNLAAGALIKTVVDSGENFGRLDSLAGVKLNLEFVSANPTGPVHLGGARWAAVGDSLARVFEFCGAAVTREYYFNDHGAQIDRFSRSLLAAAKGAEAPEDGYVGEYINEIAQAVVEIEADVLSKTDSQAQESFRASGVDLMFTHIRKSLEEFGVHFDVYFHENSLYESGAVQKAIQKLQALGHMYESEGALWLRSSDFGDDRDRVVLKSDGEAAYIAGDIAYYLDKRERGFDRCIYMLGADHHGYVPRMYALCQAFGDEPGKNMEILIGQMVNLVKDGEPVRMSKRAGNVVTMDDLVELVGIDAARYALARSSINSSLDIDLDQLSKKTNDNPVFYVQYAHARTVQVAKNAASFGVDNSEFLPELLEHDSEAELIAKLAQFPQAIGSASEFREPHRIARYLEELAGAYHRFYDNCRVTPLPTKEVGSVHRTRLWLNSAAQVVFRNGLGLLGVSAPERM
jgi:arginyl-tRNA synthetase